MKVQICNWLLTRRCNLSCSYCRIVKQYKNMPNEYQKIFDKKNEISVDRIKSALFAFKMHNPNMFHIFYGGEPTLRKNTLKEIVRYCNNHQIYYTIITNCTEFARNVIRTIDNTYKIQGLSASIDPIVENSDRGRKTAMGFEFLKQMNHVPDRVGEITIDRKSLPHLEGLLEKLTDDNICASLTLIDLAKSNFYDFSNVTDLESLPEKSELEKVFNKLKKRSDLNIHMKDQLLDMLLSSYPADFKCHFNEFPHTLTVDCDGSMRLCLRIKGLFAPKYDVSHIIAPDGLLTLQFCNAIKIDYDLLCKGCNWTCPMMGIISNKGGADELTHSDKRKY